MSPDRGKRTVRRRRQSRGDDGEGLIGPLVAITIFFLLLVATVEFIVDDVGRAALQHTLAHAARAGAVQGGGALACQDAADRSDFLGGSMRQGVVIVCRETPDRVIATATGEFEPWLPNSWPWRIHLTASAARQDQ